MFYTIDKNWLAYLSGQNFSNGLVINYFNKDNHQRPIANNLALQYLLTGKSVIHVGCADHLPFIEEKRKQGTWLHDILLKFTGRCLGVDINRQAVEFLTRELGYSGIIEHDMSNADIPAAITEHRWDVIFLGDVLEHIDNPVQFLADIHKNYSGRAAEIVVSGPNAFCLQNLVFMLQGQECVNSDHRYWFTPYTLAKILVQADFAPSAYALTSRVLFTPPPGLPPDNLPIPPGCDTITMVASFQR